MENSMKRIFILLMLLVSIAMFSIVTVSASKVNTRQTYTADDDGIQIETKYEKISTNKITFNAMG